MFSLQSNCQNGLFEQQIKYTEVSLGKVVLRPMVTLALWLRSGYNDLWSTEAWEF
ncbi:hypothetical protein PR202_ga08006 [Eleusine coracana subsp. coracana]|uniref:Uncharacterized protein n=1 Tax=Eleusine coracana subsp. coracana TaxID=191504 RepID=A0AAV5C1E1_ELECO|nr:hypothetical protein PR202_ga08006 [Eleusine coracana subsp. coracana]